MPLVEIRHLTKVFPHSESVFEVENRAVDRPMKFARWMTFRLMIIRAKLGLVGESCVSGKSGYARTVDPVPRSS